MICGRAEFVENVIREVVWREEVRLSSYLRCAVVFAYYIEAMLCDCSRRW